MSGGHTIYRAARDQRPMSAGKVLSVASPQGRFYEGAARLDGETCIAVEAFSKHLIYQFKNEMALHIHLGIFGRFCAAKLPAQRTARRSSRAHGERHVCCGYQRPQHMRNFEPG